MMRRIIISFLMLLMLTPAMVCVMTVCPEPARAGVASADVPPCHGGASADHDSAPRAPMLAGDCLMNDLGAGAQAPDVPFPALAFILVPFLLPALLSFAPSAGAGLLSVRAPPGPRTRVSFHRLLITSRILQ